MDRIDAVLLFQAANGYQETYNVYSWNEYHLACQVMERRGFLLAAERFRTVCA